MLRAELLHLFRRRRIHALLVVLALVPVAIVIALKLSGGPDRGEGPTFLNQVTNNGVFATLAALVITLPVFLPLAVSIVAGDAIAGEAGLGTLRYLLIRPSGRSRLLAVKGVDLKAGTDVFEMRGIDRSQGCIVVVRPDQYVAHVLPLDGYDALAGFFARFMIAART